MTHSDYLFAFFLSLFGVCVSICAVSWAAHHILDSFGHRRRIREAYVAQNPVDDDRGSIRLFKLIQGGKL